MGDYTLYYPLLLVVAGLAAALIIVWAFPGTDERIGFALAIAGVALALVSMIVRGWMDLDPTPSFAFVASITVTTALLIWYIPRWNMRLAFLVAICGMAIGVIFVLRALR
jgi:hypothetical protein